MSHSRIGSSIGNLRLSRPRVTPRAIGRRCFCAAPRLTVPVTFTPPQAGSGAVESVERCPDPACSCAETPETQPAVDFQTRLAETAAGYSSHVVIATGKSDWPSKIENDGPSSSGGGSEVLPVGLASGLKKSLGRQGAMFDPSRPVLVTNSSFPVSGHAAHDGSRHASAYVFPAGIQVSGIPDTAAGHEAFARFFLSDQRTSEEVTDSRSGISFHVEAVTSPTVLICSHMSRDARCGILGPILYAEFERHLHRSGVRTQASGPESTQAEGSTPWPRVNLGMCSHVGGHRWAGNVIIHMPRRSNIRTGLAGRSVWYGRVEPRHVEGIINTTIMSGKVIEELSRGIRA